MDFFLVGVVIWGLIGVSILLFISGLWKKSSKAFFWSGIVFLFPAVILYNAHSSFRLLILLPLLAFLLGYFTKKKD